MVLSDDAKLADKARSLRNLSFEPGRRFYHRELGFNFRLTNMQAALGLAQLERLPEIINRKRWLGQEYTQRLKDLQVLQLPVEAPWAKSVYWMYGVVLSEESGMDARLLAKRLEESSIETRPFFLGMHEQPVLRSRGLFVNERYPVAERLSRQGLYLPSGLALTEQQLAQVCDAVRKAAS